MKVIKTTQLDKHLESVNFKHPIKIAVASGKGGTGKTTVATSLALSLCSAPVRESTYSITPPILFLDCDVEAPNAHIFLCPEYTDSQDVGILIPQIDEKCCTYCGKCAEVCQYHAVAVLGRKTLVFPQLCHGCGCCTLICPEKAIHETSNVIGRLEKGISLSGVEFARGVLNIGEPMAVPVIRELKNWAGPKPEQTVILDVPPGVSCPVVESVRGADFLLLVTEPTPFGLHDLRLAVELGNQLRIPTGVIVNRCNGPSQNSIDDPYIETYCKEQGLPIMMRIPYEREIAEGVAHGKSLVAIHPEMIPLFRKLFLQIPSIKAI